MITFTVHEPPNPPADRMDRAEKLTFVKDGFQPMAAAFAPFWLLAERLWLPFLGYAAIFALAQWGLPWLGIGGRWGVYTIAGLNLLTGFEADTLKRWSLARRGWRTLGSISGRNREECERRFFEAWLPGQPILSNGPTRHVTPPPAAPQPAFRRTSGILGGLFGGATGGSRS
jgi:Protein of unknown function (DUF2628)